MTHRSEIVHRGEGLGLVVVGPVIVQCWTANLAVDPLVAVLDAERALLRAFPSGIATLLLMRKQRFIPPAGEARRLLGEIEREIAPRMLAMALVIEGSGMVVAAARTLIAGLQLVSRSSYPSSISSTLNDGAAWLAAQVPGPTATEIVAAAQSFEAG